MIPTRPASSGIPALLICGATLLLFHAAHAQIVTNGSFEAILDTSPPWATSSLSGWAKGEVLGTGGPNQNMVDGLDTSFLYALPPHTGSIAAAFNSQTNTVTTGGYATLSQTLTTDAGQFYDLTFWLANPIQDAGNFNNMFSVSWDGALLTLAGSNLIEIGTTKTYQVAPDTSWFQVTVSGVSASSISTPLVFNGRNSDWATLVDDVVVTQVPEPATAAMLGIGALLLGVTRRRRS